MVEIGQIQNRDIQAIHSHRFEVRDLAADVALVPDEARELRQRHAYSRGSPFAVGDSFSGA